jgi:hypothetical protein
MLFNQTKIYLSDQTHYTASAITKDSKLFAITERSPLFILSTNYDFKALPFFHFREITGKYQCDNTHYVHLIKERSFQSKLSA